MIGLIATGVWRSSAEIIPQFPSSSVEISYSYDAAGRLTSAAHDSGQLIDYAYDNNGNLISRVDNVGFDVYTPIVFR